MGSESGYELVPLRLSLEDVGIGVSGFVRRRVSALERWSGTGLVARFDDAAASRIARWANSSQGEEFCFGPGTLAYDVARDVWLECLDPLMERYRREDHLLVSERDEDGLFCIGYDWLWREADERCHDVPVHRNGVLRNNTMPV